MTRQQSGLLAAILLGVGLGCAASAQTALEPAVAEGLWKATPVWTSPGGNAAGSMPLGNGVVGANVWVEETGDLVVLLSRVDSLSECERLLKLGRVRIQCDPVLMPSAHYRQWLDVRTGTLHVHDEGLDITLVADCDAPTIHIEVSSVLPRRTTASLEVWRTETRKLVGEEQNSSWLMHGAPDSVSVMESADVVVQDDPNGVTWFHRNETSVVPFTLEHQGLESLREIAGDPLFHRTFGGRITGDGFRRMSSHVIATPQPTKRAALQITTECRQTETVAAWRAAIADRERESGTFETSKLRTAAWWSKRWNDSYVFVAPGPIEWPTPQKIAYRHPYRVGFDSNGQNRFEGEISAVYIVDQDLDELTIFRSVYSSNTGALGLNLAPNGNGSTISAARDLIESGLGSPDSFTCVADIKPARAGLTARIVDRLTAGQSDGMLLDLQQGRLRAIVGNLTLQSDAQPSPGELTRVAVVYDDLRNRVELWMGSPEGGGKMIAKSPDQPRPTQGDVSQAWALQRYVTAAATRGEFPVKFNGSIFTVAPKHVNGRTYNEDFRNWGGDFWWQNTRLPYHGMLARGDGDLMKSLFDFYSKQLPLCRARAKAYHGVDGAYFPETMTTFGTYANADYGWDRGGKKPSDVDCAYWRWAWNQGPELVAMMLDHYDFTEDESVLQSTTLPMADAVLAYFDTRFARDARGILVISPTQSIETYWDGVTNDLPCVVGLREITDRLCALPTRFGGASRPLWERLRRACPEVPIMIHESTRERVFAPAEKFNPKRFNCENPELYAVWPFQLSGVGRDTLAMGRATFRRRVEAMTHGWTQDGQQAARLGLADDAATNLLEKVRNSHRNFRFPVFWGPNFDWLPDQCHGGNLMTTLEEMLLQSVGRKIYLCPALPTSWTGTFRLHAAHQTTVTATLKGGVITQLDVVPESRRKDIVVGENWTLATPR